MSAEENLKKLGLTLPDIPKPVANYVPFRRDGDTEVVTFAFKPV